MVDVESAHFMSITDMDINQDVIVSGGKDCKVKVWMISDLLKVESMNTPFVEFGEHSTEVTQVRLLGTTRAFSGSLDKQFKVYDIPSKLCIKTIQT